MSPVVSAKNLGLTFQTGDGPVHALSEVNLNINPGDFVSFIGPSGCGKTTFLRVIADLEKPTGGTISVNGKSFTATLPGIGNITGHLAGKAISDPASAIIGIRPERLRIVWEGETADHLITGKVVDRNYFGEVTSLSVGIEGQADHLSIVETNDFGADDIPVGSDIRITYDRDAFIIMQG